MQLDERLVGYCDCVYATAAAAKVGQRARGGSRGRASGLSDTDEHAGNNHDAGIGVACKRKEKRSSCPAQGLPYHALLVVRTHVAHDARSASFLTAKTSTE